MKKATNCFLFFICAMYFTAFNGIILLGGVHMSKRIAYPIFNVAIFILLNTGLRLLNWGLLNEGIDPLVMYHIYNIADILFVLYIPVILVLEQRTNPAMKKYLILYTIYIVYSVGFNALALEGFFSSDGVIFSIPLYLILLGTIYLGYLQEKKNKGYRIGRSMMVGGSVHLIYLFIIPTNIERLLFTYDQMSLNPFVFIILIMQSLILDDVLIEKQVFIDSRRVVMEEDLLK